MDTENAEVAVFYDSPPALNAVKSVFSGYLSFGEFPLADYAPDDALDTAVNVFCVNVSDGPNFEHVKQAIKTCRGEILFILPTHNSDSITRLRQCTKADYFVLPLDGKEFRCAVKAALNRYVEKGWLALEPAKQKALTSAVASFGKCFDDVAHGKPIPMAEIQDSCRHICEAAVLGGLDSWINALDSHHNYSFRHSMFVCGSLTYFAQEIGIRGTDLEQLTVGGLIHDVGKSLIPLEILDKPGKLDDGEWVIMRQHPDHSQEVLYRDSSVDPDMIAMAVQHHEKLDGTGYPKGLSNGQISDHVRLTAIADVYSALIDKRSYKGSMSSEDALEMMCGFEGHLDMDLLRKFRSFTLDNG